MKREKKTNLVDMNESGLSAAVAQTAPRSTEGPTVWACEKSLD